MRLNLLSRYACSLGVADVGEIGIVRISRQLALEGLELLGAALVALVEALHLAGVVVAEEVVCVCCGQAALGLVEVEGGVDRHE